MIGGGDHDQESIAGKVVLTLGRRGDLRGVGLALEREGVPQDVNGADLLQGRGDDPPDDRGAGAARDQEIADGGLGPERDDAADRARGNENEAALPPVIERDKPPMPPDSFTHPLTSRMAALTCIYFFL